MFKKLFNENVFNPFKSFGAILMFALIFGACSKDEIDVDGEKTAKNTTNQVLGMSSGCGTNYVTFLKANGEDHGNPLSKKAGDVYIQVEGENLVVYLFADKKINNAGVIFGNSLEDFDRAGILAGSGSLADRNIIDGKVANYNANKREAISGGVKFTFAKTDLPAGELLCIVYCNRGWGYGTPNGPSGTTGNGAHNNGQIIELGLVNYCDDEEDPDPAPSECFGQTEIGWAAGIYYDENQSWATFTPYVSGSTAPILIYSGNYPVGFARFEENGGMVTIQINIDVDQWKLERVSIQGYEEAPFGEDPSPERFEYQSGGQTIDVVRSQFYGVCISVTQIVPCED